MTAYLTKKLKINIPIKALIGKTLKKAIATNKKLSTGILKALLIKTLNH